MLLVFVEVKSTQMVFDNIAIRNQAIADVLSKLGERNYKFRFRRDAMSLYCVELQRLVRPDEFKVDEFIRFEVVFNPDADRILYAISLSMGEKGFLIDTCNVYTDNISMEMTRKLNNPLQLVAQKLNTIVYE
jgi:hypothetical protein